MEDRLMALLSEFGYPVRRQGSLLEDEPYPDAFFTFWQVSGDLNRAYDNQEYATLYTYDVNFYTVEPEKCYDVLRQAIEKLKKNGFEAWGDAYDAVSDLDTHIGRGISVQILKIRENNEED